MKNNRYPWASLVWMTAIVLSAMLLLSSCGGGAGKNKGGCHQDNERYAQLDSLMGTIGDMDSLLMLANQSHDQNDAVGEMLALKYRGKLLRHASRYQESVESLNACLDISTRLCDTIGMVTALNSLGTTYRRLGNLSKANGYHYKALRLSELYSDKESNESLVARVESLNGIGNIELELCNFAMADSVLRLALEGENRLGREVGMAINYANLGSIKRSMGEIDSARVYYRASLEHNTAVDNKVGIALCHLHFGELDEDENRYSHAQNEYKLAYDMLKDRGDKWHWLDACLALASVSIRLGEADEAHRYASEALQQAEQISSMEHLAHAHLVNYELALLDGDPQRALGHYEKSEEIEDSIYGLKKTDEMRSQRIAYQNDRKSGEMNNLARNIDQLKRTRNMQLIFTLLVMLMAAAIIGALAYAMRVRNRSQRLMHQVEETRSLFFTNVVHQLRTPLSSIMGAIDGIVASRNKADGADTALTDEQRENYEIIERQGNNLLTLVDRILEVGSVRSAITELDWRTCDAVTFMHMILESYREHCVERHIELTYAPREAQVDIDTVPHYLSTIVGSLIENAINYSREFGKITVTSRVEGGNLIIRVADNGMGIGKEDLPHVFEPFYRSADAEALVEGVGIGLTVVRDMAMAMGGTVAVDSMKDRGSVFTVKLPCKRAQGLVQRMDENVKQLMGPMRRKSQPEESKTVTVSREGLPVVLVVEDHSDVARLVGLVLGNEEYNVHYASDGVQGLAKAKALRPDLIITDVKMPLMDGIEMCRQLRQQRPLSHIPVIMLTARNSETDRVNGIKAGADAYLVKPFVREELRAWVDRLLENRRMLRELYRERDEKPVEAVGTGAEPVCDSDADAAFLARFAREVDGQLATGNKLDLDKIALSFKMGETQLRRKLQSITGKNVPAYITQLRMEKAMKLLQDGSDTLIGDIAEQCGFQDVAYFSRVFRQHYGMTPTQARMSRQ